MCGGGIEDNVIDKLMLSERTNVFFKEAPL